MWVKQCVCVSGGVHWVCNSVSIKVCVRVCVSVCNWPDVVCVFQPRGGELLD